MEDYEENIDQYVRDEKKIVTFSWLSVELNIPVHTAKQLLWAYLQKHPQLKASYLVSGETANERIFRVVPAGQLEDAKKSFRRVVGVHVFSIQETTPTDSALLVSEDVSLRRSMIDNGDALTHPLLDGRYNAVSYAPGRELRRAGSGVRPDAAKSKSLPPSDFRSKQKEEKVDVAPPMTKAKTAVSAELMVKEGVKSVAKPKGMMQFFGKGSKPGKADDEGENASPAPQAAVSVKAEEKDLAAVEVKKEAPKRAASAKDFFAPRAKSDAVASAPAAAKVKEEKRASSGEDEEMADAASAKPAVAEAKAANRKVVASDEEESAPLNASQGRKKRVIQDSDEEDADFAAAPAKRTSPDAKSKEEPKSAKKAADTKSKAAKKQAEAGSDGESPKKKKTKSKVGGDEAGAAEGDVKKEKKRKTKEDKGEAKAKGEKKTKSEVKAEKGEGGKEPKKAKKRKGSDLEESDNEASGQPAPPAKSIANMFQPPASSQPSSALSVGSGSGPTPKRKVKQTRRYKNEKGYLVSETIEVEVDDDEPAPPAAPAPQPAKKAEEPKAAAAKSAAPAAAAAGVKKEKEEDKAAAAAEPAKKVAQSNITSFFRKK